MIYFLMLCEYNWALGLRFSVIFNRLKDSLMVFLKKVDNDEFFLLFVCSDCDTLSHTPQRNIRIYRKYRKAIRLRIFIGGVRKWQLYVVKFVMLFRKYIIIVANIALLLLNLEDVSIFYLKGLYYLLD